MRCVLCRTRNSVRKLNVCEPCFARLVGRYPVIPALFAKGSKDVS